MKKRITIKVDGRNRTVLAIWENPNNKDLNMHITSGGSTYQADTLNELVAGTEEENYIPTEKYISVHNSPNSAENNLLKRTINYVTGEKETSVQVTGAIKSNNLYTPALFRVCGDLSRDRYLITDTCKDETISLGAYTPTRDQLRFMVVISNKDKPFTPDREHPSNDILLEFSDFSVTFIWSYLNQASHPHAIDFFLSTTKEDGPIAGFDWWQIYNFYTDLYMASANEYFEVYNENG
ncbi:MAG: hypothetical protein HN402_10960 [Candidatus Scalindua sp.]|jgi:hypothetical protein|nr:hypothetical protein [Candidatus Scalindua sp.]MBT6046385.1 hypothetical protein [Candidatus Scalindua sp.]